MPMRCFITQTASYLPGPPIANDQIECYLGRLAGEAEVKERVLAMNGIVTRHYAQDQQQQATADVYGLAARAAEVCLADETDDGGVTYLAAGTTYAPLAAPGIASILHARLGERKLLTQPVEIASHAGICCSSANALVGAVRVVAGGSHDAALCVGAEHASEVLKSSVITPIDDRAVHTNIRNSRWFMSVFLRFMLSDGAGAILLRNAPAPNRLSLQVNWTHARSFASEAPLCMKLENRAALLSQDVSILSRHLFPCAERFLADALARHDDSLDAYKIILPHISSFFFQRKTERAIAKYCRDAKHPTPYWTNLATVGNSGAASIFVLLDEYLRRGELRDGDRLLLLIPESGQFNFVAISLTAVAP